jgi:trigger factor
VNDFEFRFDLGIAPEFEVQGASSETAIEKYKVEVIDEVVEKELENARKQVGKRTLPEDDIKEGDLLKFNVEELEGDQVKDNGWAATFSILMEKIVDEDLKKELLTKKTGDKVRFNVFELEENQTEEHVKKYLLDMKEDEDQEVGPMFEGEIVEVSRVDLADLDQEFFDQFFGAGEVNTVTEAKEKLKENYAGFFDRQADSLLFRDIKDRLMALNELTLPDEFLKRWLISSSEKNTKELVEKDYENFAKDLRWTLIRNKLIQQYELQISEEELRAAFADRVRGYFGNYGGDELINSTVTRLMEDQKQVEQVGEEIIGEKLFQRLKEEVTVQDKAIKSDEFEEVMKAAKEEAEARRNQSEVDSVLESGEEE